MSDLKVRPPKFPAARNAIPDLLYPLITDRLRSFRKRRGPQDDNFEKAPNRHKGRPLRKLGRFEHGRLRTTGLKRAEAFAYGVGYLGPSQIG